MAVVRCTAFFRDDDGHGWSEQHDINGGDPPSLQPLLNNFRQLMLTWRVPLLGGDAFYIGCRVSYKTTNNQNAVLNKLEDLAVRGTTAVSTISIETDAPEVAVIARFQNSTSTASSSVFLRGVWDQVVRAGQLNFGGVAGTQFKSFLDGYVAALIAGQYGWQGRGANNFNAGTMIEYTENPSGTVSFVLLPRVGSTALLANQQYSVRFSRINNSKSILNTTFVVSADTPTSVTTLKMVATSEFQTRGSYSVNLKNFIPYGLIAYYKLGRRATGRPFGVGRGRQSVRTLH